MDPAYMRFTIDKRQRKPLSALGNLAQCPDRRDECLQYVKDTGLYTLALELFKDQPDMWVTGLSNISRVYLLLNSSCWLLGKKIFESFL